MTASINDQPSRYCVHGHRRALCQPCQSQKPATS